MDAKTTLQKHRAAYMAAERLAGDTSPDVLVEAGEIIAEAAVLPFQRENLAIAYAYALSTMWQRFRT